MRRLTLLMWSVSAVVCISEVRAGEFYSWTDPSGTVVITDDPKQIPPAEQRRDLMTHHFPALPASPASRTNDLDRVGERKLEAHDFQSDDRQHPSRSEADVDRALGDDPLPDILLDQPEQSIQPAYLWIPLQTPYTWGGRTLTGFWSHRRVASPEKAFRAYLRRQGESLQADRMRSSSPRLSIAPGTQMGGAIRDTVYEQVRREREAMQQRGGLLYGSDAAPHSSSSSQSSSPHPPASNGSGAAAARR